MEVKVNDNYKRVQHRSKSLFCQNFGRVKFATIFLLLVFYSECPGILVVLGKMLIQNHYFVQILDASFADVYDTRFEIFEIFVHRFEIFVAVVFAAISFFVVFYRKCPGLMLVQGRRLTLLNQHTVEKELGCSNQTMLFTTSSPGPEDTNLVVHIPDCRFSAGL